MRHIPQPRRGQTASDDPLLGGVSSQWPCRRRIGCHDSKHRRNSTHHHSSHRFLALAAGLLCRSSSTSAFSLSPGRVSRAIGGNTAVGSSASHAVVGFSSRASAFGGLPVIDGCYNAAGGGFAKLTNRNSRGGGVGGLSMGIPKLFRWLTDQYPVISQRLDQGLNEVRAMSTVG